MPPTVPPPGLTGWQVIAFFTIASGVALVQSYFAHKKIDAAMAPKTDAAPAPEEKKS